MMADIATASFLGRNTAATGDPEVLSIATAKTMLNLTDTNSGDQTILHAQLPSRIVPGQTVTFHMTYTTRIPKLVERGCIAICGFGVEWHLVDHPVFECLPAVFCTPYCFVFALSSI